MSLDAAWARRWIELAAADVAEQRDYLVDLDRAIGDGDHGENMDRGFKAAVEALGQAEPASVAEVLKTVAKTLMSTVGGAADRGHEGLGDRLQDLGDAGRLGLSQGLDGGLESAVHVFAVVAIPDGSVQVHQVVALLSDVRRRQLDPPACPRCI